MSKKFGEGVTNLFGVPLLALVTGFSVTWVAVSAYYIGQLSGWWS